MIYRLVKRDIAWKASGVLACICPLAALVGLWQPGRPSGFFLFWLFSLVLLTLVPANRRCTSFEAALPIAGWDLYCARLLSNLILIWIPVFRLNNYHPDVCRAGARRTLSNFRLRRGSDCRHASPFRLPPSTGSLRRAGGSMRSVRFRYFSLSSRTPFGCLLCC